MILVREEDRTAAEKRKKRSIAAYIVLAAVYLAAALLLLFLSPDRYTLFMIGDILLTVLFGFFSVFFFTVFYDDVVKKYRLYDKVLSALVEREYGIFLKEEEKKTIDGVPMRILIFRVADTEERELHLLSGEIALEKEKRYLLEIRAGVLTEIGEAYA